VGGLRLAVEPEKAQSQKTLKKHAAWAREQSAATIAHPRQLHALLARKCATAP